MINPSFGMRPMGDDEPSWLLLSLVMASISGGFMGLMIGVVGAQLLR